MIHARQLNLGKDQGFPKLGFYFANLLKDTLMTYLLESLG
jgi:hypothetical protein